MPTWRGANRQAQIEEQKQILQEYFSRLDGLLRDDQIFYVNLHFLVGNIMDYGEYQHIRPFPAEYETYDFLALCDMLVTDYSSVFFDFAVTGKKIILFPYDLEEYLAERGTYMSMDSLPFPQVFTAEELPGRSDGRKPHRVGRFSGYVLRVPGPSRAGVSDRTSGGASVRPCEAGGTAVG